MIIEMLQVHSASEGPSSCIEYVFDRGGKIAEFHAKDRPLRLLSTNEGCFEGEYKGKDNYKVILERNACPNGYEEKILAYQLQKEDGTKIGMSKQAYNYYNENNELIGTLKYITVLPKKEKFFQLPKAYQYQEFTFKGQKYEMYDVRKKGMGVFYCIYKDNNLVALIEKNLTVINWLDNYKIYALDDVDVDFLCLATSHYDYTNFEKTYLAEENGGPHAFSISTGDATNEWRKEILDKYDSDFKNKIIAMEK